MGVFRKKGIIIEAIQLKWETWGEICKFVGDAISETDPGWVITAEDATDTCGEPGPDYIAFTVTTTSGEKVIVRHGDWIIPDYKPGTFYPCKPDLFEATYEPV